MITGTAIVGPPINGLFALAISDTSPLTSAGRVSYAGELARLLMLFVTPLDAERRWYRYHGLLAELLRLRLHKSNPELWPVLHGRATARFAATQMPCEAVEHTLAAGDSTFAADQIEAVRQQLSAEGEHATLQRWLNQITTNLEAQ